MQCWEGGRTAYDTYVTPDLRYDYYHGREREQKKKNAEKKQNVPGIIVVPAEITSNQIDLIRRFLLSILIVTLYQY